MQNNSISTRVRAVAEAGFIRSIDPQTARRQFNISAGLVAVLCLATLASALTMKIHPSAANREYGRVIVQAPQLVHIQQAGRPVAQQPGG